VLLKEGMTTFQDIDHEKIHLCNPKHYDSIYVSKVKYDTRKFDVTIDNVQVLQTKLPSPRDMYIKLKLDKQTVKDIVKLEKSLVNIVSDNTEVWFKNRLRTCAVDEHFQSNIIVDDRHGTIFKCRLEEPSDELCAFDNKQIPVNITMRLACIRFTKKIFTVGWDIISVTESTSPCMFKDEGDDDEDEYEQDDDVKLEPDDEDMSDIIKDLMGKSVAMKERLQVKLDELTKAIDAVKTNPGIMEINFLHDVFENMD
jgi:hypothetical protein